MLFLRRHVSRRGVGTAAEEVLFQLFGQILPRRAVRQVEAVLVDQHGLMLDPLLPGFLGYVFPEALAQFSRVGREIQTLGLAAELDAFHHSCLLYTSAAADE